MRRLWRAPSPLPPTIPHPFTLGAGTARTIPRCSSPRPLHVLVVDDDATVRDVVRRYLAEAGFEVSEAATGPDALARAAEVAARTWWCST